MPKNPKYVSKNRFAESQFAEEEIVLAEVDVNSDDLDIPPVSIDNFLDEDKIIDSVLLDNQTHDYDHSEYAIADETQIDDLDLINDLKKSAQFEVRPIANGDISLDDEVTTKVVEATDDNAVDFDDEILISAPLADELINIEEEIIEEEIFADIETHLDNNKPEQPVEKESDTRPIDNAAALQLIKQALLSDHAFIASLTKPSPYSPYIPPVTKVQKGRRVNYLPIVLLGLIVIGLAVKCFTLSTDVSKLQSLVSILEEDVSILHEQKPVNTPEVAQSSSEIPMPNSQTVEQVVAPVEEKASTVLVPEKIVKKDIPAPIKPIAKKLTSVTTAENHDVKVPPKKDYFPEAWVVNVIAFKNETEAKMRSVKLISQGIPVKITAFHTNNGNWYQLKVEGFKTRENAQSYANKLKKSINLNTISVGAN